MERKTDNYFGIKIRRNGMELECKIFGRSIMWDMWWKWKGNGMSFFDKSGGNNF